MSLGHPVDLYAYAEIAGLPDGVRRCDAETILPRQLLFELAPEISHAMRADVFRMALLAAGAGVWLDTDMLLLRPIPPFRDVMVGRERGGHLCNAALGARPDLPMMQAVVDAFTRCATPRWGHPKLRWRRLLRALTGRPNSYADHPMHGWGRHALAHFVISGGLGSQVLEQNAFYHPLAYGDAAFRDQASASLEDDASVIGLHCFSRSRAMYADAAPDTLVDRARRRLSSVS